MHHHPQKQQNALQAGSTYLRVKTEAFFRNWTLIVIARPWLTLLLVLGSAAAIIPQLRHTTTDFSTEAYLPKHDSAVLAYDDFRYQFGQSGFGLVTIETDKDVFTMENLQRIKALQEDIEKQVPHIDKIDSLVSIKHTSGNEDSLVVRDMVELWPQTAADMPAFKNMVLGNPTYVGNLVSENGRLTSLIITLNNYSDSAIDANDVDAAISGFEDMSAPVEKTDEQKRDRSKFLKPTEETDFARILTEVAEKHEAAGFKIHVSGQPVVNYRMAIDLGDSMQRDTILGLLVLAILLAALFHRISGVILPLFIVFITVLTTIALMPIFGFPFTGTAQILPVFLLAVGIADSMHILAIFYRRYDEGADKREAIIFTMTHTSLAVLMTSVTTAAGLLSFSWADLRPTQMLGIFGSSGTMLALFYTITLIPAVLMVAPIKRRPVTEENSTGIAHAILKAVDRFVYGLSSFGIRHAKAVFVGALLLAAISAVGVSKVYFSHDPVRWYPKDHPTRVTGELIDKELSGTLALEVIFDSGQDNGLYDPAFLRLIEKCEQDALAYQPGAQDIKKTISILGIVKDNHKILHEGKEEFYSIPGTREEVAQELLLFENAGSDQIEEFTDTNFRVARVSMLMPFQNMIGMKEYLDTLTAIFEKNIEESGLQGVKVHITGLIMIFAKTLLVMLWGTISSYFQSFALVGALMFLMMGNFRTGLLAFGPNLLPVLVTIGIMGWVNMPMDLLTSMLGCIVIGIAVDDTIHFMHHYRSYSAQGCDPETAVRKTLDISGRAIVFTSVVLVGCFLVHMTDTFVTSKNFGFLLSFALGAALICNLLVVPALMKLFWNKASS